MPPRTRLVASLLVAGALATGVFPLFADSEEVGPFGNASSMATEASRQACDRALRWLVTHQEDDGAWRCDVGFKLNEGYNVERRDAKHVGVTALAGTAFLAAGSVPGRGPWAENVERALDYVLGSQDATGFISRNSTRMYSHAFATLFLAEVYGMTRDPKVRAALQRAVEFTYKAQNAQGGWRYVANAVDSDMSITVCQVVALRAAKNKGISVPKESIDRAVDYVLNSAITRDEGGDNERGAFLYQFEPNNEAAEQNTRTSFALTAAGLTTLYGAGLYDDEDLRRFIAERQLRKYVGPRPAPLPHFADMLRYVERHYGYVASGYWNHYFYFYGNYYAAQAMFIAGGAHWERYYRRLRDDLVRLQRPDGSWDSIVGPSFSTAVGALLLEVPNNYLPIFQR